jgi:hypothetical protein
MKPYQHKIDVTGNIAIMKKPTILSLMVLAAMINACEDSPFFSNNDLVSSIEGTWHCSEESSIFGSQEYLVDISRYAPNSDSILLDNFYNIGFGKEVIAVVNGQDIEIPNQVVDGFTISGTGYIQNSANSVSFTYTADIGGGEIDHLTALFNP